MYGNALASQSWFIALLRSVGGLKGEAEIPIAVGRGGLIRKLSQVLDPLGSSSMLSKWRLAS
jgi:hypothetical protein